MKSYLKTGLNYFLLFAFFVVLSIPVRGFGQTVTAKKSGKYVEKYDRKHKKVVGRYKNYLKEGAWIYFSFNQDTLGVENYVSGKLHGRYFQKTNNISVSGTYETGKKISIWKYHRGYPEMDSICTYAYGDTLSFDYEAVKRKDFTITVSGKVVNGKADGTYRVMRGNLDKTGKEIKMLEGNYSAGVKAGKWVSWDKNEKVSAEREFRNDTLIASSNFEYYKNNLDRSADSLLLTASPKVYFIKKMNWHSNGQKKDEKIYLNRERDSVWCSWYSDGNLKSQKKYKYGKVNGKETEWYENGKVKWESTFVNGTREGIEISRNQNGTLKDSGMYVNNKKDGKWIEVETGYKKDPAKYEQYYKEGKKNGKVNSTYLSRTNSQGKPGLSFWEDTGKKRSQGTYVDNKLEGKYTEWYPSGKTKIICSYKNGNYFGKYTEYDEAGKMIFMKDYSALSVPKPMAYNKTVNETVDGEISEVTERDYFDEAVIDEPAVFPGGMAELMKYLSQKINYPAMEKENGITGKVYIGFIINTEGGVEDVKVMKGIPGGSGLEKEAVRVIKSLPAWKPAKHRGKLVKQRMVIPINFHLN